MHVMVRDDDLKFGVRMEFDDDVRSSLGDFVPADDLHEIVMLLSPFTIVRDDGSVAREVSQDRSFLRVKCQLAMASADAVQSGGLRPFSSSSSAAANKKRLCSGLPSFGHI